MSASLWKRVSWCHLTLLKALGCSCRSQKIHPDARCRRGCSCPLSSCRGQQLLRLIVPAVSQSPWVTCRGPIRHTRRSSRSLVTRDATSPQRLISHYQKYNFELCFCFKIDAKLQYIIFSSHN